MLAAASQTCSFPCRGQHLGLPRSTEHVDSIKSDPKSPQPPLPFPPPPVASAFHDFTVVQTQVDLWPEGMGCLGA